MISPVLERYGRMLPLVCPTCLVSGWTVVEHLGFAKENPPPGKEVCDVQQERKAAPPGFRWIFVRYRRVKNSTRLLDAHDYGYECWAFLVRA